MNLCINIIITFFFSKDLWLHALILYEYAESTLDGDYESQVMTSQKIIL